MHRISQHKTSQRNINIHFNNIAMSPTKNLQLDHNQIPTTYKNPKHKINVVLDQSLSKTRQREINGESSRYPQATHQAMQIN